MKNITLKQLPPLSLYIHIPWCIKKCPYCDFNSHKIDTKIPEQEYLQALITDLEMSLPLIWGRTIQSIFIGGGTPSLISGQGFDYLLQQIRARVNLSPYAEITLEANPSSVESKYINEYSSAGINRISLGIQSFNDIYLKLLGRVHDSIQAKQAIEVVAKHFNNFNLDLIYGLPNQTIMDVEKDIETAIKFSPTHISAYNLTIEPNTYFAKFPPQNLPNDDNCYEMQDNIINMLQINGYQRYETSAYSKKGKEAQHNLNYWQFGDYLGIGAGAHSKLSFHDKIMRISKTKHPNDYLTKISKNIPFSKTHNVQYAELPLEFMMNALRLTNGFSTKLFTQTTGIELGVILPKLLTAEEHGFITLETSNIRPTEKGRDFLNNLLEIFIE